MTTPTEISLGEVLITQRAQELLAIVGQSATELLDRHHSGDWGDVCTDDVRSNDQARESHGLLVSGYDFPPDIWIVVLTAEGHQTTSVLTWEDYPRHNTKLISAAP